MLSLEPELHTLRPILGDARAGALIARERREIFSVYPELRIAAWLGATLLAAAAGLLLRNNLERIGPLALAILIAAAAAACYVWTWFRRAKASVVDDYVVLLGALLVSADVAFIESQFHLFDGAWKRHLLILAVVHAAAAYVYGSRMVLSLSIVALAAYIGFERSSQHLAIPAFITAAILIAWREIDRRWRGDAFSRTFEHFAATIALTGGLTLLENRDDRFLGCAVTVAIAAFVIWWGFRKKHEPFVLYAVVYAVIAIDACIIMGMTQTKSVLLVAVLSVVATIVALLALHARFKEVTR